MRYLGDLASGRDNNFNLIRAVAATAVLVSHAYPISLGPGTPEPLTALLGHSLGGLSVYAFFVISGFLIAASYERSRSRTRFVTARILRLYPGLIVSLILIAFVMGPLVTTLSGAGYFANTGPYMFMAKNLALVTPQYTLPGVFKDLPYTTVEGSIWTLFYEVACYGDVFLAGIAGALKNKSVMAGLLGIYLLIWLGLTLLKPDLPYHLRTLIEMALPFAVGTGFYLWRDRLPLSLIGVVILVALATLLRATPVFDIALVLALGYGVFWLAYIPGGAIRAYNQVGDYSYGIYIYAFPLQGLTVWLFGPMDPLHNIAIALPLTLIPSILSWHLIEKPALDARTAIGAWLQPGLNSVKNTK